MRFAALALVAGCGAARAPSPAPVASRPAPIAVASRPGPSPWLETPSDFVRRNHLAHSMSCDEIELIENRLTPTTTRVVARCLERGMSHPSPGVECVAPRHRVMGYIDVERTIDGSLHMLAPRTADREQGAHQHERAQDGRDLADQRGRAEAANRQVLADE